MTWEEVVACGRKLPDVEEGACYGTPALRVRGRFLARLREDGETLAIRCDPDERPFLVEKHAELFVTPHYQDYPIGSDAEGVMPLEAASPSLTLIALPAADPELVRELVEDAWAERAPKRLVAAWVAEAGEGEA
jgi:hypothetical protein